VPLTLILMRHAKSAWDDPLIEDYERTLNARGRAAAPAIADWLVAGGHLPDKVLVSSARRTVETWERMSSRMPQTATMESAPALYLAGPDIILNVIKSQTAQTLMVICHNPGIADFAERIAITPPDHSGFRKYPTAATTVMEFNADSWSEIGWKSGRVLDFTVPRDLID